MWFSVVCTFIDNNSRHHSGANLLWIQEVHNILTTVMMNIVVDKTTDNAENHVRFVDYETLSVILVLKFPVTFLAMEIHVCFRGSVSVLLLITIFDYQSCWNEFEQSKA